jgi:DNA excision repair protein ERCC-6
LWELHQQGTGGIIGDEMGLGKTVQIVSFLSGLYRSVKPTGRHIVVCPASVMQQWVAEFHRWFPEARVILLHQNSTSVKKSALEGKNWAKEIVKRVQKSSPSVLIATYEALRIHETIVMSSSCHWQYVILDEGHKVRNPDAEITLTCKRVPTAHRIILTGSPVQNNLIELWSLFDFVFPGKLGTLPTFQVEFSVPIMIGGYANANPIQVETAYKCAVALRDLIRPYLLRRLKKDVLTQLPAKNEQILFCQLTDTQIEKYQNFLKSEEVHSILDGKRNVLYGVDVLRKICNHPDLLFVHDVANRPEDYGNWERSGKLKVLQRLFKMWKDQGDTKVLFFSQTVQMLEIIEKFVKQQQLSYLRMDGTTPVKERMKLVTEFNTNKNIFVFLLSTKVGGLGLNLTGASKVIIFDPGRIETTFAKSRLESVDGCASAGTCVSYWSEKGCDDF